MAGTPHHALGSRWLTVVTAATLALAVVAVLAFSRRRFSDGRRYAAVGGSAYATVYLSLWAVVPAVFWRFAVSIPEDAFFVAVSLGFGAAALVLQSGIPLYLYAERGLKTPITGLFVASFVSGYLFLQVGGEAGDTFSLFIWSTAVAPVGVAGIGALGAAETGLRRATKRVSAKR